MTRQTRQPRIREDRQHKVEVHVAGVCLRWNDKNIEALVGHRRSDRELYPGKWECGGGQIRPGESFEGAAKRQFIEEFGIKVRVLQPLRTYEILQPRSMLIPGLVFLCQPEGAGFEKIELNQREFTEYKWITAEHVADLDLISGVRQDIEMAMELYQVLFPGRTAEIAAQNAPKANPLGFRPPTRETS